ncbi:MAG: AlbA family DNA-binding domain-containing protein [Luteibaculaceae bacterium]
MIPQYLAELIALGEGKELDFKYRINDAAKIAISLVAFANSSGGTLLIGVKDNGSIVGVADDEEIYMIESAAQRYAKPPVPFKAKAWEFDQKVIVEITVEPSADRPHFAKDKEGNYTAYERIKDQNHSVNRIITKFWQVKNQKKRKLEYNPKIATVLKYVEENGKISTAQFQKITQLPKYKSDNLLLLLLYWGVLIYKNDKGQINYILGNPEILSPEQFS